jgi:hypothetical protein
LTVPWDVLNAALLIDRSPAAVTRTEQSLEEMLVDPMVQLLMRADGVSEAKVRELLSDTSKRNVANAKPK